MKFSFALVFKKDKAPAGYDLWQMINNGPAIIKPTSVNNFEPLEEIENVDIERVCLKDYIWRNGRKCLGMYEPCGWKGKATLAILLTYSANFHRELTKEVYDFIRSSFDYRLLYGVSPSLELMGINLDVHRWVSCGAIPPDEEMITTNSDLFEFYEEHRA